MRNNQLFKCFIVMALFFLIDSVITYFLPYNLTKTGITYIPALGLMLFVLLSTTIYDIGERFFFSAVCGLYYAICYSNSLMIYVLIYTMITFVRTYLYQSARVTLIDYVLMVVAVIAAKELIVYYLMRMTAMTELRFGAYFIKRFIPTVFINSLLSPLVYLIYKVLNLEVDINEYENSAIHL